MLCCVWFVADRVKKKNKKEEEEEEERIERKGKGKSLCPSSVHFFCSDHILCSVIVVVRSLSYHTIGRLNVG